MDADIDNSRSSRRPRPEVAVYRPGSGPLKKSGSNVENIQPSTSSHISPRGDIEGGLVTNLRNVNLGDESNRSKEKHVQVRGREQRPPKTNNQRNDKVQTKARTETHHPKNVELAHPVSVDRQSADILKKQGKPPLNRVEKLETGSSHGSNQDLRQLLIEKRLQRNNQPLSAGLSESSVTGSQSTNSGREKNERQSIKSKEQNRNGLHGNPLPADNLRLSHQEETSSNFSRNSDKRSSGKRRNDRKPRVGVSHSDGHLVALTNNNTPDTSDTQMTKDRQGESSIKRFETDKIGNGKERKEGNSIFLNYFGTTFILNIL